MIAAMRFVLFLVLALLLVALLPILLPLVAVSHWLDQRRLYATAMRLACLSCNRTLGKEAVDLADEYWGKHMDEMLKNTPGIVRFRRLRVDRRVHAICTSCGAQHEFISRPAHFVLVNENQSSN